MNYHYSKNEPTYEELLDKYDRISKDLDIKMTLYNFNPNRDCNIELRDAGLQSLDREQRSFGFPAFIKKNKSEFTKNEKEVLALFNAMLSIRRQLEKLRDSPFFQYNLKKKREERKEAAEDNSMHAMIRGGFL